MKVFKIFVIGLYYALAFLLVIYLGDLIYPGILEPEAFSILSILVIFLALQTDSFLNLGSLEDEKKEVHK